MTQEAKLEQSVLLVGERVPQVSRVKECLKREKLPNCGLFEREREEAKEETLQRAVIERHIDCGQLVQQ